MPAQSSVELTIEGPVATVMLRRPEVLNALGDQVLTDLLDVFARLETDGAIRVILLTGHGERAFVAGAEISEFEGTTPEDARAMAVRAKKVTEAIAASTKPVVAVVNGLALGGGFELALACDIRIAASTARFGLPEVKLGVMPGAGGTVRLGRLAGPSVARHLIMTGTTISAERAWQLGIVASIHSPAELGSAADALARDLAELPAFALRQIKGALNTSAESSTSTALEIETRAFALCFTHPDQVEGTRAFLEKRKPNFNRT